VFVSGPLLPAENTGSTFSRNDSQVATLSASSGLKSAPLEMP